MSTMNLIMCILWGFYGYGKGSTSMKVSNGFGAVMTLLTILSYFYAD